MCLDLAQISPKRVAESFGKAILAQYVDFESRCINMMVKNKQRTQTIAA